MKKEKYSVNCGKCGKEFTSTNELDTDNEGKCPSCKKRIDKIVKEVQKRIDQKRLTRGSIVESPKTPMIPNGITKLNYKDLLR